MTLSLFLLLISGILSFSLFYVGSRFSRQQQTGESDARRIRMLQEKIRAALLDDHQDDFASTLANAGMTTKIQGKRLNYQMRHGQQAPEKYTFVLQLAAQGMGAEEIADIINISTAEARQLLSLSSMAVPRS